MKLPHLIVAALVVTFTFAAQAESRTWKDATSGKAIEAEFVSSDGTNVTLKVSGKDYTMPLTRLSAEDQAWVKQKAAPAPAATPAASTTPGELKIAGVTIKPGVKAEFELPLSETLLAKLKKRIGSSQEPYSDADMTKAAVGLFVPEGFNPAAKTYPIMIVSVTISGRDKGKFPSSVKSMGSYIDAARSLGWVVLAADCPGGLVPGLPYNRCGLAEAGLEAMAAAWPASKTWPIATGGFSGGAKFSGWLGGWFCEDGRKLLGMFMGGCNEDMATAAMSELRPPRKEFTAAKVFLSAGTRDKIAGPGPTESVAKSLKRSGFDEVRLETFEGEHEVNKEHVAAAMKWFLEAPASK